jgi:hypothetical protein
MFMSTSRYMLYSSSEANQHAMVVRYLHERRDNSLCHKQGLARTAVWWWGRALSFGLVRVGSGLDLSMSGLRQESGKDHRHEAVPA